VDELKCSKCGKQTNELNVFSCPNCVGKKCPHCGKKRGDCRFGLVDPYSQLESPSAVIKKFFFTRIEKFASSVPGKKCCLHGENAIILLTTTFPTVIYVLKN
jgi:hypothetical protein